jgi:RHS repeat-associated protein
MSKIVLTKPRRNSLQLNIRKQFTVLLRLLALGCCIGSPIIVRAQQPPYYQPSAAAYTPLTEQPGAPAGSYPLSGFDNVNLFNGHMNFQLPLMQIGGRGRAGYTMTLSLERQWQVRTIAIPTCNQSGCTYYESNYNYTAYPSSWNSLRPGLGPGILLARQSGIGAGYSAQGCSNPIYYQTLTRLTFIGPDGTEMELRDQQTGGQPIHGGGPPGCYGGPSRGKVFVTADGSSATFVSDAEIFDDKQPHQDNVLYPSGYLLFRDGTRYCVVSGKVAWIRDTNGNKVSFTYSNNDLVGIDDSLNRHVSISGSVISFKGTGGSARTIKVYSSLLSSVLRKHADGSTEYTIKTYPQLFGLPNSEYYQAGPFDIQVTSAVELPDGRQYQFRYDSYGNLAQVILPTGGRIEYDWTTGTYAFGDHVYGITTRLVERRTAVDVTTANYETKTIYPYPASYGGATVATVDSVDPKNANALLGRSKHYFYGWFINNPADERLYPRWQDGREYQTEVFAGDGTTVLRRVDNTWQQRAPISWWTGSASESPANDPRLVETITTLADTNQVSKITSIDPDNPSGPVGYDQYNNRTKVWEYDYGAGAPGPLVRKTVTTFWTSGYDTLLPSSSAPDLSLTSHIRNLPWQVSIYDAGNVERSRTIFEYDNYVGDSFHATLVPRTDITGHDISMSTEYSKRGNPTAVSNYLLPAGTAITSYNQFDIAGNLVKTIDPRSTPANIIATTVAYDDNFGGPNDSLADHDMITELGTQHTFAFPTQVTNALNQSGFSQYDYYLGQAINTQDLNGVVAAGYHSDFLDRLTQIRRAIGTAAENQTTFQYDDDNRTISTKSDLGAISDNVLVSSVIYDGLGRTIESRRFESGTSFISVQTQYDGAGRAYKISNPFRTISSQSENPVWTTETFDALGRVISVMTPDNGIVSTSYAGNSVIVTDQAGKRRKSVTDALGRLTDIWEDPQPQNPSGLNYQTTYTYDGLDNLVKVNQGGQQRFFMYDSLRRLIRSRNPEQGTWPNLNLSDPITGNGAWSTGYEYDAGGNLTKKTDARGVESIYVYDSLNRNLTIDYSDTLSINPDVTRLYDGAANGVGRLWKSYAGGNEASAGNVERTVFDSYDALGRPLVLNQSFKLNNEWKAYQTTRTYNRAGKVLTQTYPSQHFVNYNYDNAGRLANMDETHLAFTGNLGDGNLRTYSRDINYASAGQMTQEKFGTTTSVYNKLFYNSRLQLAEILVSSTIGNTYDRGRIINGYSLQCSGAGCDATDNNGNLRKQQIDIPTTEQATNFVSWYQQYEYDSLNRLQSVREVADSNQLWRQWFSYDRWGNRTIDTTQDQGDPNPRTYGTGINNTAFQKEDATNRLYAPGDLALPDSQKRISYDAAGNQIKDIYTGYGTATFDADNHITTIQDKNGGSANYTYNADGQRTRRKIGNKEIWQIYGMDGELLAEYPAGGPTNAPQKEYGYRNGQLLISAESGNADAPPVFADDFNDNSLNANSWTVYYPTSPWVNEQSQQLQITLLPNTAAYNGVYSNSTYDLTNRMMQVESVQAVSQAGWCENYLELELNANNYFMIQVGAGNMIFRSRVNGVNDQTSIPYDGTANRFWRIRHDQSANLIYFETSANDAVWITRKTVSPGFALTALRLHLLAGAYGTGNSSPGTAKYDNVKLMASVGSTSLNVPNASFETPVLGNGNFQYGPSGGSWTFANGGGISGINSPFTGVPSAAPDGVQVAFIQSTGTISQSISGFQANTNYVITFQAIQRTNCCNAGGQDIVVYIDDTQVGSFHPSGTAYVEYSTGMFSTSTGAHTVKFAGVDPLGTGVAAFIDNVRITGTAKPGYGVQWLVTDQLGTPRMIVDQAGTLASVKRHDYLPFGEELFAPVGGRTVAQGYASTDGVRQQFTQKERDVETGLDYFGARYFSSTQGRFTSVDPSRKSVISSDPESWNRYTYAKNNPLNYVDQNGKWPTWIHELIIDRALPGLKDQERQWIKEGSWGVDDPLTGGQDMSRSNEHGMTIPGQSQDEAAEKADTFINNCVDRAKAAYFHFALPGNSPYSNQHWAFLQFGMAFHTVSDMTSPAHEGYQVWTRRSVFLHRDTEKLISPFRMGLAVGATISLFKYTFGQGATRRAVNYTPGSQDDPSVQDIQRQSASPMAEAESLYEYRLGLKEGLDFDWARQRGRRGMRQSERPIAH